MKKSNRLEHSGPGDYFGDEDYRHFAFGKNFIASINWQGDLEFTVDDYELDHNEKFDMEEFENHTVTLYAKPLREKWVMLSRIARTIGRFGSAEIRRGNVFWGELRCDGSFATFS